MLKRHKANVHVHVDALAASIASVIAMAGDTIYMPKNSMLMIRNLGFLPGVTPYRK
ncbi:ATP-dependent Clp protease proteolytic subunit [Paenibacillus larvae]|nr:ATP-dependent Clp protease proteolytic subunit [Paenibacillus larvae]